MGEKEWRGWDEGLHGVRSLDCFDWKMGEKEWRGGDEGLQRGWLGLYKG
jgi:hypothetical protein